MAGEKAFVKRGKISIGKTTHKKRQRMMEASNRKEQKHVISQPKLVKNSNRNKSFKMSTLMDDKFESFFSCFLKSHTWLAPPTAHAKLQPQKNQLKNATSGKQSATCALLPLHTPKKDFKWELEEKDEVSS